MVHCDLILFGSLHCSLCYVVFIFEPIVADKLTSCLANCFAHPHASTNLSLGLSGK